MNIDINRLNCVECIFDYDFYIWYKLTETLFVLDSRDCRITVSMNPVGRRYVSVIEPIQMKVLTIGFIVKITHFGSTW